MDQYFTHYQNWEDYQNGLWLTPEKSEEENHIQNSIKCLQDPEIHMRRVISEWKVSTRVNLTNKSCNRKSWLGQAACCIAFGSPESMTRVAWFRLTEKERINANKIAKTIIEEWERDYSN